MERFIVIDGNDGSGKTVQTDLLSTYLTEKGLKVYCLDFPNYNSPTGKVIKSMLEGQYGKDIFEINRYAASYAYALDRYFAFRENDNERKKSFNAADIVIANRYTTSNFIHQGAKLLAELGDVSKYSKMRELEVFITNLKYEEYVLFNLPQPTDIVYLHTHNAISDKLIAERNAHGDNRKDDIGEQNSLYRTYSTEAAALVSIMEKWTTIFCSHKVDPDKDELVMRHPLDIRDEIIARLDL